MSAASAPEAPTRPSRPPRLYRMYVGGEWVDAHSGETLESVDGATRDPFNLA